jgi:hypothetical protein
MPMRIRADTLREEVAQIRKLLEQIDDRIQQIPGEDIPARDDLTMQIYEYQVRGELMLTAERLTALVEVLE